MTFILECLKADVEKKIERSLVTPSDFKYLSLQINVACGEPLSSHTLMRIWGYIRTQSKPGMHSLSLLCCFLGFKSFSNYAMQLNIKKSRGSAFLDTDFVAADSLNPGDLLSLKWKPAREVTILYLGKFLFRVVENTNSRLNIGDEFQCVSFAIGSPFIARIVNAQSVENLSYIGAKNGGLTALSLANSDSEEQNISKITESDDQEIVPEKNTGSGNE